MSLLTAVRPGSAASECVKLGKAAMVEGVRDMAGLLVVLLAVLLPGIFEGFKYVQGTMDNGFELRGARQGKRCEARG